MENWKEEKVILFPRRLFLRLAALALAAVLALGLTACDSLPGNGGHIVKPSTGTSQPFEMHFIDVGQALSVLVECDGQFMLYDGGNVDDGSLVVSYLQKQGVEQLQYVFCSHAHEDHVGGLAAVMAKFPAGHAYSPVTVSTCMFYTGLDPYTLKPVFVEKTPEGKALQRALLQYYEPRNAEKVVKALQLTHREDLIPLLVPAAGRRAVQRTARRAESAEVTIHNDGTYTVHSNQKGRSTGKNTRAAAPAGRQPSPGARFAPNSAPGHKTKNNQQKENATWKTGKKKK